MTLDDILLRGLILIIVLTLILLVGIIYEWVCYSRWLKRRNKLYLGDGED